MATTTTATNDGVTAVHGKDKILMFRKLGDKTAAAKLALQTEHTLTYERSKESKKTKDGAVVSDGGLEVKVSINAVSSRDAVNTLLRDSVVNGWKLECWEIDLAGEKKTNKYPALYMIGELGNWEIPANVEELTTISTEMTVDGVPQSGYATLTAEQEAIINYVFKDTTAVG